MAKLADGNCWMVQNLRLKLTSGVALNNVETDLNSKSSWTPNRTTEVFSATEGNYGQGRGNERWDQDPEGYRTARSGYRPDHYNTNGVYYTHNAAAAGSVPNGAQAGYNVPDSICPKGWRLPTSHPTKGQGEFWRLANAYKGSANWRNNNVYLGGSHRLMQAPASFSLSGRYYYGNHSLSYIGSRGHLWSSTLFSNVSAYYLYHDSSNIYPFSFQYGYAGHSVRCIAR